MSKLRPGDVIELTFLATVEAIHLGDLIADISCDAIRGGPVQTIDTRYCTWTVHTPARTSADFPAGTIIEADNLLYARSEKGWLRLANELFVTTDFIDRLECEVRFNPLLTASTS